MVILSSPSGAGKTTLVKLLSKQDNFEISVSHTTREPRPIEIPNKDYYFVSDEEFKRLIKNEEFLEYAKVFNNFYGTSLESLGELLKKNNNILFDIDWQGTQQLSKFNELQLIKISILPPDKKELEKRLIQRNQDGIDIISKRLKAYDNDVNHWSDYDHVIINDNLEHCFSQIEKIILSEKNKII